MSKRITILFIALALVVLSGIAGLAQTSENDRYGGVFTAAVASNPITVDPHMSTSTSTRLIALHVFETLFTYDSHYTLQPSLADTWETSEDGLAWTIRLRKGVLFHNGKELTAEDVKASIDRFRTYGARKGEFAYISSIGIVDPYTVKFILNIPVTTLLDNLANPLTLSVIYPKEIIEDRGTEVLPEEAIGTGPYKLVNWRPDVEFRLARFEDYVPDTRGGVDGLAGWKKAYFDEIVLVPVPDVAARMAGLETGLYDFAEGLPQTSYDRLVKDPNIEPLILKPLYKVVPQLNHTNPPMDNVYFRQALVAAINCENVMEAVCAGRPEFYRIQPCVWAPEQAALWSDVGSEYYNAANIELARELLKKANYNGEEIVYIASQNYDWNYRTALAVSQDLIAAGINVKLEFMEWATEVDVMRSLKGWHIGQSAWSMRFDPTAIDSSVRPGGINALGYSNPRIGELIDEYKVAPNNEARKNIVDDIMSMFYTDVPHLLIGDYFALWGRRTDIAGMNAWYAPIFFNVWRSS